MRAEPPSPSAVVRAAAAYQLPGAPPLPERPMSDEAFARMLEECDYHRAIGFAGAAVRSGDLPLTAGQRAQFESYWLGSLAQSLRLESLTGRATECLAAARIDTRVLKGVALANLVYPEPSWRVFRDADLLVRGDHFDAAVEILNDEVGVARVLPELRSGFDRRFGKEALLRSDDHLELDLHRTFVEGALGLTVHLPDLFTSATHFQVAGRPMSTLGPAPQLLHAAYTAIVAGDWPPRLSALRDLIQVLLVQRPAPGQVRDLAKRWRADAVLAQALVRAADTLMPGLASPLLDWARSYQERPIERLLVASHRGPSRAFTRHLAALVVAPGIRGRVAYLRAIAWPDSDYLERRHFTRRRYVARALPGRDR